MKYCMAIGVLLVFFGCKTQKTELKDAVTVSKSGQTLFIAAKDDKIIVRSCPANSVPSGTSPSELPALIERNCPSTGSNEKTFARTAVLSFIQDFYARSYIPAGEPMDEELKRLKEQGRSEAEAKKIASLTLRSMISTRVFEIETELKAMNDYYNRNADDVTSEIKAQLEIKAEVLAEHKKKIDSFDTDVQREFESNVAKKWAADYSSFLNDRIFTPILTNGKLLLLEENNPFHARVIGVFAAISMLESAKIFPKCGMAWQLPVIFSSDRKIMVRACQSDRSVEIWGVEIWDAVSGKILKSITTQHRLSGSLDLSPDGKLLAVQEFGQPHNYVQPLVRIYSVESGTVLRTFIDHREPKFSGDSKLLAMQLKTYEATVYDIINNKFLTSFDVEAAVNQFVFTSDNTELFVAERHHERITKLSLPSLKAELVHSSYTAGGGVFLNMNGTSAVVTGVIPAKVMDLKSLQQTCSLKTRVHSMSTAFSSDGRFLATGNNYGRDEISLFDVKICKLLKILPKCAGGDTSAVSFGVDDTTLLVGTKTGDLCEFPWTKEFL